jgi:hypothetical protein
MVEIGSGARRTGADVPLRRFGAYLAALPRPPVKTAEIRSRTMCATWVKWSQSGLVRYAGRAPGGTSAAKTHGRTAPPWGHWGPTFLVRQG